MSDAKGYRSLLESSLSPPICRILESIDSTQARDCSNTEPKRVHDEGADATGLPRGDSRWPLQPSRAPREMPRACPVEIHVGCKFGRTAIRRLAASVNLHGASPWHPWRHDSPLCSNDREAPPGKLVASSGFHTATHEVGMRKIVKRKQSWQPVDNGSPGKLDLTQR